MGLSRGVSPGILVGHQFSELWISSDENPANSQNNGTSLSGRGKGPLRERRLMGLSSYQQPLPLYMKELLREISTLTDKFNNTRHFFVLQAGFAYGASSPFMKFFVKKSQLSASIR